MRKRNTTSEKQPKVKRRRGRPRSWMTVKRLLFQRAVFLAWRSKEHFCCQEDFAIALGIGDTVGPIPKFSEKPQKLGSSVKTRRFGRVPLLKSPEIAYLHEHKHLPEHGGEKKVPITVYCKQELLCYAFIMPDDKMKNDGIRAGDIIIAAENIHPGHDDMVACRLPGSKEITVRRFYETYNPFLFDLNEPDGTNSVFTSELADAIVGVVMGIERDYHPVRFEKFEAAE